MSRAIFEKPLADLSWSDFESVISNGFEEDQTLEFKETLPAKDGIADSWQLGQNKIGSYARDTLAKEVVAFANAYGGVIIVGIVETDEKPPKAKEFVQPLIRNCIGCAERLGPSLRSIIDPPIAAFDIRAFPKPNLDTGEGLIVIRVGSSTQAPHGVGRPPEAYVRRGSASEPLTMRDLHNLFWETRTRRERIVQIRSERKQLLLELEKKKQAGRLMPSYGNEPVGSSEPHLAFRCTAIPEEPLDLRGIAAQLAQHPVELPPLRSKSSTASNTDHLFGVGRPFRGWQPKAHAARAEECSNLAFSLWTIGDDGLVDVTGLSLRSNNKHYPGWFSVVVAQVLLIAEKLRLRAGRPDVPLVIDAQFHHDGTALAALGFWEGVSLPDETVMIGPFVITTRAELQKVHQEVEREIWFGLGISRVFPLDLDFESAFSTYLGVTA
jgi:hypothetical protein